MIEICYRGGLGERMFQYCFGRILAERWKYQLKALPLPWFPNTRQRIAGDMVFSPVVPWKGDWPHEAITGRRIMPVGLQQKPGARIVLDGNFRRVDLIEEAAGRIRHDWLRPVWKSDARWKAPEFAITDRDLVISVRPGPDTSLVADGCLDEKAVRQLAATVAHDRLIVLTDHSQHPLLTAIRDIADAVLHLREQDHFRLLSSGRNIAIGQHLLDWWAGFLAESAAIHLPPLTSGPWSGAGIESEAARRDGIRLC